MQSNTVLPMICHSGPMHTVLLLISKSQQLTIWWCIPCATYSINTQLLWHCKNLRPIACFQSLNQWDSMKISELMLQKAILHYISFFSISFGVRIWACRQTQSENVLRWNQKSKFLWKTTHPSSCPGCKFTVWCISTFLMIDAIVQIVPKATHSPGSGGELFLLIQSKATESLYDFFIEFVTVLYQGWAIKNYGY